MNFKKIKGLVNYTYTVNKNRKKYSINLLKKQAREFERIYEQLGFSNFKVQGVISKQDQLFEFLRYDGRAIRFSDVRKGIYELKSGGRPKKIFLNQFQAYVLFNHNDRLGYVSMNRLGELPRSIPDVTTIGSQWKKKEK